MWHVLKDKRYTMTMLAELRQSDKLRCQNGDRNYKKKYNKHHKRMWQKDISSFCRKLTTISCVSFCVSGGDCTGLFNYASNRLNYHHNGKSSSWSLFSLKKMFFVFFWLSCYCLPPASCDKMRGKKWKHILHHL